MEGKIRFFFYKRKIILFIYNHIVKVTDYNFHVDLIVTECDLLDLI